MFGGYLITFIIILIIIVIITIYDYFIMIIIVVIIIIYLFIFFKGRRISGSGFIILIIISFDYGLLLLWFGHRLLKFRLFHLGALCLNRLDLSYFLLIIGSLILH